MCSIQLQSLTSCSLMHCKQVWLLYISEHQLHSPTNLLALILCFKAAADVQSVLLSQYAHLASFGLLCSNTSLHWLLKQIVLHSMDYVSPTSCGILFLVLLGTGIYFFYLRITYFFTFFFKTRMSAVMEVLD